MQRSSIQLGPQKPYSKNERNKKSSRNINLRVEEEEKPEMEPF